jgi:hypothetical protein
LIDSLTKSLIGVLITSFSTCLTSFAAPDIFGVGPGIALSISISTPISIAVTTVTPVASLVSPLISLVANSIPVPVYFIASPVTIPN